MQKDTNDIFKQIGNLSADVHFIYHVSSGNFTYLSPAFESVWGMHTQNVLNHPERLLENVHEEDIDYVNEYLQQITATSIENQLIFRLHHSSGEDRYILATTYGITDMDTGKLIAGIARDITIQRTNTLYAEKINGRKNTMLTVLAHDLKGPTGIIDMMASSLLNEATSSGNEQMLSSIRIIQELCQRNIHLIKELLDAEYLESPEVELRKERIDLIGAINDMINLYKKSEALVLKTFIFHHSVEKLYIYIDALKLVQVFNNLVSNAIKFTHENGIIELTVIDYPDSVIITVKDDGIGIPVNVQPFLFDKFTRARRRGLMGEETTGLGMSAIKTLVELHNGRIWFESKEDKGTTFYLELPK